jgi:DNA-binding CsgD family transcriptional regulator
MEDANAIILPPEAEGGDELGLRQALDLWCAAEGLPWAQLEIRAKRSDLARTLTIGRPTDRSTTIELAIVADSGAALLVPSGAEPRRSSIALLTGLIERELHHLRLISECALLRGALTATSSAVLLFGSTGEILYANPAADALLSRQTEDELTVENGQSGPQPLFGLVVSRVGQLLDGVRVQPWRHRLTLSDGTELNAEIALLAGGDPGLGRVVLTVLRGFRPPPDRRVDEFASAHHLSPREREVLHLLALGHDTAELADRLGISPHTVRDHLKHVFRKTSSRSRSELLSAVAGAANHHR